ncbi:trypsin-like serine protease, partial [Streptomyces thermolilacinus]|uniref:trypsin-like serine protease n=1 Tax=Streptomyces thermolilacinus TaxID=285540 RepID=UPI00340DD1A1
MLRARPRSAWMTVGLAAVIGAGLLPAHSAAAAIGTPDTSGAHAHTAQITVGDHANARGCSGTLIAAQWLLTSQSCFTTTPGTGLTPGEPREPVKVTLGTGTYTIAELFPRTDRDVLLARLDRQATGVTPARIADGSPAAGTALTAAGYGRTKTTWVPDKIHTAAFTATSVTGTALAIEGAQAGDAICQGDAGGPVTNAAGEVVALASRSWKAGCLGAPETETRRNAEASRVDDLRQWVVDVRAAQYGWKSRTFLQTGQGLYQGVRLADGTWSDVRDVQAEAGSIGGVLASARAVAAAGINRDTHVLAIDGAGKLRHAIRAADGTWSAFGDVGSRAGVLGDLQQVSAVSIGHELHVVALAGNKVFHTRRDAAGQWTRFGDVAGAVGPIGAVTSVATASVGGHLHTVAVTGGKPFHTIRDTGTGKWTGWGDMSKAVGTTGPVSSVAIAGVGTDAHVVIATDNGTKQYHTIRNSAGGWSVYGDLAGVWGTVTARSVSAAHVAGELQVAAVTADGRVLHTIRHADRSWAPTVPVPLTGTTGTPT